MSTDDADNGGYSGGSCNKTTCYGGVWGGHCVGPTQCGSFYPNVFQLALQSSNLKMKYVGNSTRSGVVAIGVNGGWNFNGTGLSSHNSYQALFSWTTNISGWTEPVTVLNSTAAISSVNFGAYKIVYIPSDYNRGGITEAQNAILVTRKNDLADYINNQGGSLIVLGQISITTSYNWLPQQLSYHPDGFSNVTVTTGMPYISSASSSIAISHNAWHGYWDGPVDWAGIYQVLAYKSIYQDLQNNATVKAGICTVTAGSQQYCQATVLLNYNTILTAENW